MQLSSVGPVLLLVLAACVGDAPTTTPPSDAGAGADAPIDAASLSPITIETLRNPAATGHPTLGALVKLEGAVVTGVKSAGATHGFFIQDPSAKQWAGAYVFVGASPVSVAAGDIVTVVGKVAQFKGFDQVDVSAGSYTQTGTANVPPPLDVTPSDIRAGSATASQYQSMILRVKAVTAKTATAGVDFTVTSAVGNDDLVVTSYVANDTGSSPFPATIGQTYTSIVGRGYKSGATDQTAVAKLAPVSASEVVSP